MRKFLTLFVPVFLVLAPFAWAAELTSAYTKLKVENCKKGESSEEEGWATWTCKGHKGIPVYFAHADLREYVGYGPNAKNTCSARTTFTFFNAAGKTIEWRLKAGKPVATILRFHVEADGKKDQFLMVTKLDGADSCPMGYVDARLKHHNQRARDLADQNFASFSCMLDKPIVVSKIYRDAGEFASAGPCDP